MSRGIERMKDNIEFYKSMGLAFFTSGSTALYFLLEKSESSSTPLYGFGKIVTVLTALASWGLVAYNGKKSRSRS